MAEIGTMRVKSGLAEMLKGGVIMDVTTADQARIAEDQSDRRRYPRVPVDVEAKMRELGATGVEARVLNISEQGFMAETEANFEVGTRVWHFDGDGNIEDFKGTYEEYEAKSSV